MSGLVHTGERTESGAPILALRDREKFIPRAGEDPADHINRKSDETKIKTGDDIQVALLDERHDRSRVAIRFRKFNGQHFLDIRLFKRTAAGKLTRTEKGCAVRLEELWILQDAIGRAIEVAKGLRR